MTCRNLHRVLSELCVLVFICVGLSGIAVAQHPIAVPHAPVAPVHVSPPPMYHPPLMQPPIARPPITYAPVYTPPRNGMTAWPGTSIILPPVRPIRPIRPVQPAYFIYSPQIFFGDPFWQYNSCVYATCGWFWPWTFGSAVVSYPGPVSYVPQAPEAPVYVYGGEREDFPQLFLKDGTILNVTDYWVVDGQLHFKMIDAIGRRPVEQSVPFEELDLQKTVDANTARGFRFVLRNEPFEEYVRDHPEGPPPTATPQHP